MSMLLKAISDSDTVLMVSASSSFPSDNAVIQIGNEQIAYSVLYMGTLYGCTRGVNGTSAASHVIHSEIQVVAFYQGAKSDGWTLTGTDIIQQDSVTSARLKANVPLNLGINPNANNFNTYIRFDPALGIALTSTNDDPADTDWPESLDLVTTKGLGIYTRTLDQSHGGPTLLMGTGSLTSGSIRFTTPTGLDDLLFDVLLGANYALRLSISDAAAGTTGMLLYDKDTDALQRVSVGAPNSGGTGYRLLRIPNA